MRLSLPILKLYKLPILLGILSAVLYYLFAYDLVRTEYLKLINLYTALFILFVFFVRNQKENIKFLTSVSFLFRIILLFSIPNLSQDFYRFIWDGRMILEGWNPYLATPEFFISKGEFPVLQAQELYNGMGALNGSHFTNYPPLNQICFVIAGMFAGKSILGSVIAMRLLIIAADFGTLHYGKKLLEKLNIPVHYIFWYILNPFVIIELTGNLHFEAVMIFFLVWSLYMLYNNKQNLAAILFACSISIKLIPLMFLPIFYQKLGWRKSLRFYVVVGIISFLFFISFYSTEFLNNYSETVGLWFQKFEFNASLYYIARELGYLFRGYNEIAIIGKIIPVVVVLFVLIITFYRKNKSMVELITAMLLVLTVYYFVSTTVHPWYIATLLILSVFTKYRFPLVWSFVIVLSYLAYGYDDNKENLWIIGLEYVLVYGVFIWELFIRNRDSRRFDFVSKND
ncbi:MAG: mannosyltransferase [Bacteroidia bacterium]|nr:mannosyltransferase [Bacteroidia bacterium]